MLDDIQLARILRHASQKRRTQCLGPLNEAMRAWRIDTNPQRVAAFIAQLGHESGELQFLEEIWGPTAAQKRYEPPSDLARRLGNTQPGDGKRFKGRGPIQITGRDNYARYGKILGLDLISHPELAADPAVGFQIAGLYWDRNGLNVLADAGKFDEITHRINGGQNGAADRKRLYAEALLVLCGTLPATAHPGPAQATSAHASSGAPTGAAKPAPAEAAIGPTDIGARRGAPTPTAEPLSRGWEAIREILSGPAAEPGEDGSGLRLPATRPAPTRAAAGSKSTGARRRGKGDTTAARGAQAGAHAAEHPRQLDVRPDALDFRDLMYTSTLVEVPTHVSLGEYLEQGVPILDQGSEGACTGYGLATVAHYLLLRRRVVPDATPVSPRMLYDLARRYDEWPGEDYSGSSARGAMKGWHKHGVCAESLYPSRAGADAGGAAPPQPRADGGLSDARVADALRRPLGAYFRVNHKDLVAMHSALAEVGILYASCTVHDGWSWVGGDGVIMQSSAVLGGHAFAIVAYDERGFWIQNSWGPSWGRGGFGLLSYDDWLENGTDIWVARLGAPIRLQRAESTAAVHAAAAAQSAGYSYADLRPHIVSVGNNGTLKAGGDYGSTRTELQRVFDEDIPRLTADWPVPRVLLYAHGGLVGAADAVQRVAEYRPLLLARQVYPLAFVWRTDYWTTLTNILRDAVERRRPEGILDATKDFMLDRLDDALEPIARALTGRAAWREMQENALAASAPGGAAELVADLLAGLAARMPGLEVHLVAHSAGSILLAPLVSLLGARNIPVRTCTLWAPACRRELFEQHYAPALEAGRIGRMALFALTDKAEQDDHCGHIYNKSLLYLVSNAFEDLPRIPLFRDGRPILGMERFLDRARLHKLGVDLVLAPNTEPEGSPWASGAAHHGDFDDDHNTVLATFRRLVEAPSEQTAAAAAPRRRRGSTPAETAGPEFRRSESSLRDRRQRLDLSTKVRPS